MTIDELTARAGAVIVETGESAGLSWEVHHVVALGAPERVILSLPVKGRRKRRSRPQRFRRP